MAFAAVTFVAAVTLFGGCFGAATHTPREEALYVMRRTFEERLRRSNRCVRGERRARTDVLVAMPFCHRVCVLLSTGVHVAPATVVFMHAARQDSASYQKQAASSCVLAPLRTLRCYVAVSNAKIMPEPLQLPPAFAYGNLRAAIRAR